VTVVQTASNVVDDPVELVSSPFGAWPVADVLKGDFLLKVNKGCDLASLGESFKADDQDGTALIDTHPLISVRVLLAIGTPPRIGTVHLVGLHELLHAVG
jgi:hypothetical protein